MKALVKQLRLNLSVLIFLTFVPNEKPTQNKLNYKLKISYFWLKLTWIVVFCFALLIGFVDRVVISKLVCVRVKPITALNLRLSESCVQKV